MRIISGQFRGKKLLAPQGKDVRPTLDRVKENIFNIVQNYGGCADKNVLDLFCGSGALGIEAISRGAAFATFVDNSKDSLKLCQKNLDSIRVKNFCLVNEQAEQAIQRFVAQKTRFDLIFSDSPYEQCEVLELANKIIPHICADGALIIIEHSAKKLLQNCVNAFIIETRTYGTAAISIFCYKQNEVK